MSIPSRATTLASINTPFNDSSRNAIFSTWSTKIRSTFSLDNLIAKIANDTMYKSTTGTMTLKITYDGNRLDLHSIQEYCDAEFISCMTDNQYWDLLISNDYFFNPTVSYNAVEFGTIIFEIYFDYTKGYNDIITYLADEICQSSVGRITCYQLVNTAIQTAVVQECANRGRTYTFSEPYVLIDDM